MRINLINKLFLIIILSITGCADRHFLSINKNISNDLKFNSVKVIVIDVELEEVPYIERVVGLNNSRIIKKGKLNVDKKIVLNALSESLSFDDKTVFTLDEYNKIVGDVNFSLASGREKAGPLRTVKKGALYYQDKSKVLGTKLDFWKNKSTGLTKHSQDALIHFEILPPIDAKKLNALKKDASDLVKIFCGGNVKVEVLDKKKKSVSV